MNVNLRNLIMAAVVIAAAGVAYLAWNKYRDAGPGDAFVSGNGRIEATEIDVATKAPGRLEQLLVGEGDFVRAGQEVARMQQDSLLAQRDEATARLQQAHENAAGAKAQVSLRESEWHALLAQVEQRKVDLNAARRKLARTEALVGDGSVSGQQLDDDRARVASLQAALATTAAQASAAEAAIIATRAQVTAAAASIKASEATLARIEVDLADTVLKAPRDGRIQYRVALPGEVLGAGGKVLNMADLSDVYMTFFLPETVAGRVALGSEVRIKLDAAPQFTIPAKVSFVASTAQFTPKTVETASERQKLMFRVKAQIDRALLEKHLEQVKTGLPGVAWLRLDPKTPWPESLAIKIDP